MLIPKKVFLILKRLKFYLDEVFEDMDILNDYVVVYLKKCLIPTVLVHNITKKENKIIQMQEVGELKPRLNKVNKYFKLY